MMLDSTKVISIVLEANGIDFYREPRGSGPAIALIPSGEGDCGSFEKVADALAKMPPLVFSVGMNTPA